ncbi:MAG: acetyl-CoA carboxylase biotin carboxylase subunit [Planctomycetota bacterium]|nr:acetyl-CoA carboxylase biotin carboxylase subunit [Planctomycetota bacterium]
MFKRILIANRGEIALRVIRTAREMGVECVAVYSDVDDCALHTRMAHVAVPLHGVTPAESYLDMDKILKAAAETGAEAIHPGYGFLSENAEFARRVKAAGLAWIGPPAEAITVMGDKIESRRAMAKANVPCVPGLTDPVDDVAAAVKDAEGIGYPIAIKAAAGGGGKGIRIVRDPSEMESAFRQASGEAVSAFGDGRLYLERYIDNPRHVEIQVMCDSHGNRVHLFERECSIQRRHQKLVEEAPCCVLTDQMRQDMGEVALRAAEHVNYEGAGTVEFLWEKGEFFFLEMNTRLQVEHPVTEMITGVDLVREQLLVAAGEKLSITQDELKIHGHAIEVRINAEDATQGYLPSVGILHNLRAPGGPWVRLDTAMYRHMEVGLTYDPMLGKLIVWGPDRISAIERMKRAIAEMNVGGVRTSMPAALTVLEHPRFVSGDIDTHFLESLTIEPPKEHDILVAAACAIYRHNKAKRSAMDPEASSREEWKERGRRERSGYARRLMERGGQV